MGQMTHGGNKSPIMVAPNFTWIKTMTDNGDGKIMTKQLSEVIITVTPRIIANCNRLLKKMSEAKLNRKGRFKIVARYVYPEIESSKTFKTRATAQRELRKWKREAAAQNQELFGRVIEEESA